MKIDTIVVGDCLKILLEVPNKSIDLIILDPPYKTGWPKYFDKFKAKLNPNGSMLWFVQPTELYDLPEKPLQVLVWTEPPSPKPIYKKYREFLDFIAWYAYGDYTFNKLLWNLMNSRFDDVIIRDKRLHKWEKPLTLIEKLILVHTNEGDLVFAPFLGSGTAIIAAARHSRHYFGCDIDPKMIKITEKRLNSPSMWEPDTPPDVIRTGKLF